MEFKVSNKAKMASIIVMAVGIVGLLIGIFTNHGHLGQRVWSNVLINGYFFFTIALAAAFFYALQYVSEMGWGVTTKRIYEGMMSFMPIGAVILLLVFVAGSMHWHHIYHWMAEGIDVPGHANYDRIIANKMAYLNQPFFYGRTIAYFIVWIGLAMWFRKKSIEEDQIGGLTNYKKTIIKSVLFIFFFAYTSSSSAWDWLMSIDTHWFSTLFGWYTFSGMWVSAMIVSMVIVIYMKSQGYLKEVNNSVVHDIGKWIFAASMLWSYLWFSQFMLIWYSDIPEEVTYYITRFSEYKGLYLGTFAVNFFLPFFVLMSRDSKRNFSILLPVCLILFVAHWLDVVVMVIPGTMFDHGHVGLLEIGMFLLFTGGFTMVTLRAISKAPLMAKNHPFYEESVHLHT